MIDTIFIKLRDELEAFLISKDDYTPVLIENIGLQDNIILTLVNIEESSNLRNNQYFNRLPDGNSVQESRPVSVNLYVLFTANFSGGDGYIQALKKISFVIEFFREISVFSIVSPSISEKPTVNDQAESIDASFKAILEMYPLTFEQVSHIWDSLGTRQLPFVMYKARIVSNV